MLIFKILLSATFKLIIDPLNCKYCLQIHLSPIVLVLAKYRSRRREDERLRKYILRVKPCKRLVPGSLKTCTAELLFYDTTGVSSDIAT